MKPVQDPSPSELAAVHSLAKFASVIADHGDPLVWSHAACIEKLVQPRGRRWHQLMHVRIETRSAISKSCTARNDVAMSISRQLLRPRRFQLCKVALRLAALGAAAEAQPCRVDAHTAGAGRFANLLCADRFWSRRDIALDLRVQRATDGEDSTASTTRKNSHCPAEGPLEAAPWPDGRVDGRPTWPQVLQFRRHPLVNGLAQRTHCTARLPLLCRAVARPQPRTRHVDLAKHGPQQDRPGVLVRQHRATTVASQLALHPPGILL